MWKKGGRELVPDVEKGKEENWPLMWKGYKLNIFVYHSKEQKTHEQLIKIKVFVWPIHNIKIGTVIHIEHGTGCANLHTLVELYIKGDLDIMAQQKLNYEFV